MASSPLASPSRARTVEQAGENAPYQLGQRDVTLADKYLKDEGCQRVVHELLGRGADISVSSLDLRGNDIRRYGGEALAELMRDNCTIEHLNLEWNFLGDSAGAGLEVLCDALKTNRTLKQLDLRNNKLNSECGLYLARLLIVNHTLTEVDLRWNNLGQNGGAAIADALVRNHYIRNIRLSGNRIPAQTIKAIEEALAKNREVGLQTGKLVASNQQEAELQRLLQAEQRVHDLQRQLSHLQTEHARTEQELMDERRRCDELTDELASLRDKHESARTLSQKNYNLLSSDLQQAQQSLHETQRLHDQDHQEVKRLQNEMLKLESDLKMVTEDRARLLLTRDNSVNLLNKQVEQLHVEMTKLTESLHAKERAHQEERAEWDQKMAHQRRMAESEKELATTQGMEKARSLQLELSRLKEEHAAQVSELSKRLQTLQSSSGDSASSVLALREQLVKQSIAHEEALAKLEAQYRSDSSSVHSQKLAALEERLSSLQSARDDLARSNEKHKKEYEQLLEQMARERKEHLAALDQERKARADAEATSTSMQNDNFQQKSKLLELEHRVFSLTSSLEAAQSHQAEQARRHNEQIESVYAKAGQDNKLLARHLRASEEERARLQHQVKALSQQLAAYEAEQAARQHNLATALSALKSSVHIVDQNVSGRPTAVQHHPHMTPMAAVPSALSSSRRGVLPLPLDYESSAVTQEGLSLPTSPSSHHRHSHSSRRHHHSHSHSHRHSGSPRSASRRHRSKSTSRATSPTQQHKERTQAAAAHAPRREEVERQNAGSRPAGVSSLPLSTLPSGPSRSALAPASSTASPLPPARAVSASSSLLDADASVSLSYPDVSSQRSRAPYFYSANRARAQAEEEEEEEVEIEIEED